MDLETRREREINFWRDASHEKPGELSIHNLINKFSEARVFLEKIEAFGPLFVQAKDVLELGGGQGLISCVLKAFYPHNRYTVSDISPFAVNSVPQWETVTRTHIEGTFACSSDAIPVADASFDLVFCFQSAHHFVTHAETLREIHRVLKPGGTCLYLHEPSCTPFFYPMAYKRVNKKRLEVVEDLLIYPEMKKLATQAGFTSELHFAPSLTNRGGKETLYYFTLQKLPFLQRWLPCTIDYQFTKQH